MHNVVKIIKRKTFILLVSATVAVSLVTFFPGEKKAGAASQSEYLWTKTFSNANSNNIADMKVDGNDNLFIIGDCTGELDFNPDGTPDIKQCGTNGLFLTKFNSDDSYSWTKIVLLEFEGNPINASLDFDSQNNIYYYSNYYGTVDFNPNGGVDNIGQHSAQGNIFITKLNADGSYGWTLTGTENSNGASSGNIRIDDSDNIYFSGLITGVSPNFDLDLTSGNDLRNCNALRCAFVSKITTTKIYQWSILIDTPITPPDTVDYPWSSMYRPIIDLDSQSNVYLVGYFSGKYDLDPSLQESSYYSGGMDSYLSFLSKYDSSGNYIYSKIWTQDNGSMAIGTVKIDTADKNNVYLSGTFSGAIDFDPTAGVDIKDAGNGSFSVFLTKLNADGSYEWTYTPQSGEGQTLSAGSLNIDNSGDVFIAGEYTGAIDFNPSTVQDIKASGIGDNEFLDVINKAGEYQYSYSFAGGDNNSMDSINRVCFNSDNEFFISGSFGGTVDFNPGAGTDIKTGIFDPELFDYDFFLSKYSITPSATPSVPASSPTATATPTATVTSTVNILPETGMDSLSGILRYIWPNYLI